MHSYKLTTLITLAKQTLVKEMHVVCKRTHKIKIKTNKQHQPHNIKSFRPKQVSDYLGFHNYIFLLKKNTNPLSMHCFFKAFK